MRMQRYLLPVTESVRYLKCQTRTVRARDGFYWYHCRNQLHNIWKYSWSQFMFPCQFVQTHRGHQHQQPPNPPLTGWTAKWQAASIS